MSAEIHIPEGEGYYTVPDLVELLKLSPSRIHRLFEDKILLSVRFDGILRIPKECLIEENGTLQPISALQGTLTLLSDLGHSDEQKAQWLRTQHDELGQTPFEALRDGKKTAVRRAAQLAELF